jgi:hypothetical protein
MLIAFRVLGAYGFLPPNFQPLPVFFLLSFAFFNGKSRWLIPAFAWILSDPLMSYIQGFPLFCWDSLSIILGVTGTLFLSNRLRQNLTITSSFFSILGATLLFYTITNTISFFSEAHLYTKNYQGFMNSLWYGPEGYLPTWVFLRNSIVANLLFGGLFLVAQKPVLFNFLTKSTSKA